MCPMRFIWGTAIPTSALDYLDTIRTRVLHGPARSRRVGPGQASMIFCGPGRLRT